MSYTVSHRQAGVKRAEIAGLIRHEYRDVDKHNGVETQHSNERIVPERTHLNQSFIYVNGERAKLTHSSQIIEELDRRLESVSGTRTDPKTGKTRQIKLAKNVSVVRNLVLQLDPDFTRSAEYLLSAECPRDHYRKVMGHLSTMISHYAEVYGKENLLAATLHLDETSPHVHLMVTPIDNEGRVRQASFIGDGRGPKSPMAMNDRKMRARLSEKGYDVELEPRGPARSHMSVDEYAKFMAREELNAARIVELEDKERSLNSRASRVHAWEVSVAEREAAQDSREALLQDARNARQLAIEEAQRATRAREKAEEDRQQTDQIRGNNDRRTARIESRMEHTEKLLQVAAEAAADATTSRQPVQLIAFLEQKLNSGKTLRDAYLNFNKKLEAMTPAERAATLNNAERIQKERTARARKIVAQRQAREESWERRNDGFSL